MDSYTTLAMSWLANHPDQAMITSDPQTWAHEIGDRICQRTRDLTDRLAPPIKYEPFEERTRRLNTVWRTAEEIAIDEHLPPIVGEERPRQAWTPLVPDLTDLL